MSTLFLLSPVCRFRIFVNHVIWGLKVRHDKKVITDGGFKTHTHTHFTLKKRKVDSKRGIFFMRKKKKKKVKP